MNEITKKIAATLDKSAARLPNLFHESEKEWVKTAGHTLINSGYTMLTNGEKIDPSIFYDLEVPKKINHRLQLRKAFERDGWKGVTTYCGLVRKLLSDAQEKNLQSVKDKAREEFLKHHPNIPNPEADN